MELYILFRSNSHYSPMFLRDSSIGLKHVRKARLELGVNLPLERFYHRIKQTGISPQIYISEKFAESTGLFEDSFGVYVTVPEKALNWAMTEELNAKKNPETGEIEEVSFNYGVNKQAVLDAWAECGYPLEWDGQKPETSQN